MNRQGESIEFKTVDFFVTRKKIQNNNLSECIQNYDQKVYSKLLITQQLMDLEATKPVVTEQETIEPHQLQCSRLIILITEPYKK